VDGEGIANGILRRTPGKLQPGPGKILRREDLKILRRCYLKILQRDDLNNYFTEMCSGSEEGSYLRLIDFASIKSSDESNKEDQEEFSPPYEGIKDYILCGTPGQLQPGPGQILKRATHRFEIRNKGSNSGRFWHF